MAKKAAKKTAKKKATRSDEKMGSPPPQRQKRQPGMEHEMTPRPESQAAEYLAAGKLKDQVALITGGDSGIGRAVSVAFAKEGADVAIVYLNEREDAEETRRLVEEQNRRCLLIEGDVGDSAFCNDAVTRTVDEFGRLDILVNNAAEQHVAESLEDISDEQLHRTFQTNIFGQFYLTRAALPHLGSSGRIINTTSITAYQGNPKLIDYSSTKGAIVAFTRSLAVALVGQGHSRQRRGAGPDLDAADSRVVRRGARLRVRRQHAHGPSRPAGRGRSGLRLPGQQRQLLHDRPDPPHRRRAVRQRLSYVAQGFHVVAPSHLSLLVLPHASFTALRTSRGRCSRRRSMAGSSMIKSPMPYRRHSRTLDALASIVTPPSP